MIQEICLESREESENVIIYRVYTYTGITLINNEDKSYLVGSPGHWNA